MYRARVTCGSFLFLCFAFALSCSFSKTFVFVFAQHVKWRAIGVWDKPAGSEVGTGSFFFPEMLD